MSLTYISAASTQASSLARTLHVWLFSNLGGTALLALDFGIERPGDGAVPLIIGLMAALISLAFVPLALPFFALSQRVGGGWQCRLVAAVGVLVVFALGNLLLLTWLPIGPLSSLLAFSRPYLGAALLAIAWLYRPQAVAQASRPKPAPTTAMTSSAWLSRSIRQTLAH